MFLKNVVVKGFIYGYKYLFRSTLYIILPINRLDIDGLYLIYFLYDVGWTILLTEYVIYSRRKEKSYKYTIALRIGQNVLTW